MYRYLSGKTCFL